MKNKFLTTIIATTLISSIYSKSFNNNENNQLKNNLIKIEFNLPSIDYNIHYQISSSNYKKLYILSNVFLGNIKIDKINGEYKYDKTYEKIINDENEKNILNSGLLFTIFYGADKDSNNIISNKETKNIINSINLKEYNKVLRNREIKKLNLKIQNNDLYDSLG